MTLLPRCAEAARARRSRRIGWGWATGLLVTLAVLLGATPVAALTVDDVAAALRTQNVYNDPAAQNALTAGQVSDLQAQISASGVAIYIAVLPESLSAQAGGPDALLRDLRDTVGRGGVYAVIAGNSFRAGGTEYSVTAIAESAFASQRSNGPFAVLEAFIAGVAAQHGTGAGGGGSPSAASGTAVLAFLVIVIAVIIAVVIVSRRVARKRRALWAAQMRELLDEDITELGERLGRFDLEDPRLDDAGRDQLQHALDSYAQAGTRSALLASEADVAAATKALDNGRYALACVDARMAGEQPPARRAPCFFDPRHGVSLGDVMWAGSPDRPMVAHDVPACAACRAVVAEGGTPVAREVDIAGVRRPYWDAGGAYAPYARGYFSGFGTTMAAAFAGTMIANSLFSPAAASASTFGTDGFGSSSGGFGGGDFGGGGFGGGDFGGGGFGGGDF